MRKLIKQPLSKVVPMNGSSSMIKLSLIESLLEEFHRKGILYCHWKSNEHLAASMAGDTDLDILFHQDQKDEVVELLKSIGFKKFVAIKEKQYKDIEDFLCLDPSSGKIIHLHAHFRLTLGEPYLKSYQLDWEEKILSTRFYEQKYGIYCIDPAFEMILLIFRESLKIRNREIVKIYLRNKISLSKSILLEYEWLKQKCTESQIKNILISLFIDYQPIFQIVTGEFNRKELLKLSFLLRKVLRQYRLCSPSVALIKRWYRELSVKLNRKISKITGGLTMVQRFNPRGGLVIGIIGADGSGKSTVTVNLQSAFRKKVDTYRIYFGRGDGRMSTLRRILFMFKRGIQSSKLKTNKLKVVRSDYSNRNSFLLKVYKCIEAFLVANEKMKNLRLMQKAKKNGMVVICDRFPQNEIMGFNDGPLLHSYLRSHNPIFRLIARREAYVYSLAAVSPPDILFKLIADAEVVEARKPGEISLEKLEAKVEGFKKLKFSSNCQVMDVDACEPLEQVLFKIRKEIWNKCP